MNVVFLGGPMHRKRYHLEDNVVSFVVARLNTYNLYSKYFDDGDIGHDKCLYKILNDVKYFYGETIFVYEKFNVGRSKIIQKLKTINQITYDNRY